MIIWCCFTWLTCANLVWVYTVKEGNLEQIRGEIKQCMLNSPLWYHGYWLSLICYPTNSWLPQIRLGYEVPKHCLQSKPPVRPANDELHHHNFVKAFLQYLQWLQNYRLFGKEDEHQTYWEGATSGYSFFLSSFNVFSVKLRVYPKMHPQWRNQNLITTFLPL